MYMRTFTFVHFMCAHILHTCMHTYLMGRASRDKKTVTRPDDADT